MVRNSVIKFLLPNRKSCRSNFRFGRESEECAKMDTKITIKCRCGREVVLEVYGGQYQDEYRGDCICGRKWVLTEISQLLTEISEEN